MIALIQEGMQVAVQTMKKITSEVTGGIEVVNKSGESFAQIRTSVDELATQLQGVSAATGRISIGVDKVLQSGGTIGRICGVFTPSSRRFSRANRIF